MHDRYLIAKSIPKKSRNDREELLVRVGMDIISRRRAEERGYVSVKVLTNGMFYKWNQFVGIDTLKCRTKDCAHFVIDGARNENKVMCHSVSILLQK